jgi:D-beta-D-heptose 7-phosphate kinase/D-beta-D-heptose 1-phosphate adenosyltransferase
MDNNKVLIIGESCVDVFVYGYSTRKSPEGDGAVFIPTTEVYSDGMAYNVFNNLIQMGVEVDVISNIEEITKRRYIDDESNHLFLRVDENDSVKRYNVTNLPDLSKWSAILISDYNKGFLTESDIQYISTHHPLVIVDTKKRLGDWCKDIKFIKINRAEFLNNVDVIDEFDWLSEKLLITIDEDGTVYNGLRYPAEKVEVVDICGAGDTFIAGFTAKYLESGNVDESIKFGNKAASVVIQHKGTTVYTE